MGGRLNRSSFGWNVWLDRRLVRQGLLLDHYSSDKGLSDPKHPTEALSYERDPTGEVCRIYVLQQLKNPRNFRKSHKRAVFGSILHNEGRYDIVKYVWAINWTKTLENGLQMGWKQSENVKNNFGVFKNIFQGFRAEYLTKFDEIYLESARNLTRNSDLWFVWSNLHKIWPENPKIRSEREEHNPKTSGTDFDLESGWAKVIIRLLDRHNRDLGSDTNLLAQKRSRELISVPNGS